MSNMNMQPGGNLNANLGETARPGQMTAAMRALRVAKGPKVLRIALVRGGRVLEERIIQHGTAVTVGPSETSTFVLPLTYLAPSFTLLELQGAEYTLSFVDSMSGRLALTSGISELSALRNQAGSTGVHQVKLASDARGKITLGDTTLLFQFVTAPAVSGKPQLPLAVRGGIAASVDWTLTVIAGFSFLFHFGVVGGMYSDWMDPPTEQSSIAGLVDMMKSLPSTTPVEDQVDQVKVSPETKPASTPEKHASQAPRTNAPSVTPSQPGSKSTSDAKAAKLTSQAQDLELQVLGVLADRGSAVERAVDRSTIPTIDLTEAANSEKGATRDHSEIKLSPGGGPMQAQKGGLEELGSKKRTAEGETAGTAKPNAGPKPAEPAIGGTVTTVPVSGADVTVAGLRGGFRRCYQQGLATDPTMQGKVVISAKISANGEVESATPVSNVGLSSTVAGCIARTVRSAQFAAPGGTGSNLSIPVSFQLQK
jgi:hypothetical protein